MSTNPAEACVRGGQEAYRAPPTAQLPSHLPHQASTPGTSWELGWPWMGKLRHLSLGPPAWDLANNNHDDNDEIIAGDTQRLSRANLFHIPPPLVVG